MNKVVIYSPSCFSLYTICVTELLIRSNVHVEAIFVKKLFNPSRFFSEFRRDGYRLIKKIWKKGILRKKAYKTTDYETIADFMKKEKILFKNVDDFKVTYGLPVVYCNDLNESLVVEKLKKANPDIAIFTGGGLLREDILKNSGAGVLNCHMGVLPQYRGMDVIEWAILENNPQKVGMTIHFMDEGVDTGDLLCIKRVKHKANENIRQIRERFEPMMCREMVMTCLDYMNGKLERAPQKQEDGKQYFMMHPLLIRVAETKLKTTIHADKR